MKRFIAAAALLLAFGGAALAQQRGYVTTNVNLRAGPGTVYPVVVILEGGTPLGIYGCIDDYSWCDVDWRGNRGWIAAQYLDYDYRGRRVDFYEYAPTVGVPIVAFSFGDYWGRYYRGRSWYSSYDRWGPPPPPRGYRPPPPGPGWGGGPPPPGGPGWNNGRPPQHGGNWGGPPPGGGWNNGGRPPQQGGAPGWNNNGRPPQQGGPQQGGPPPQGGRPPQQQRPPQQAQPPQQRPPQQAQRPPQGGYPQAQQPQFNTKEEMCRRNRNLPGCE